MIGGLREITHQSTKFVIIIDIQIQTNQAIVLLRTADYAICTGQIFENANISWYFKFLDLNKISCSFELSKKKKLYNLGHCSMIVKVSKGVKIKNHTIKYHT